MKDSRDNFKDRCPVKFSEDGTEWSCTKQISGKLPVDWKTCNFSRCPGRELTEEENDKRLLDLEAKVMDETRARKKKEGANKKDPLESLMEKLSGIDNTRKCDFKLSSDGSKWYCKKNMDLKMDISDKFCYYDNCPGRKSTLEEDRENRVKSEKASKRVEEAKQLEEIKRLEEEAKQLEEIKRLEETKRLEEEAKKEEALKKRELMLERKRQSEKLRRERLKAEKLGKENDLNKNKTEEDKKKMESEIKDIKREARLAKKREYERMRKLRLKNLSNQSEIGRLESEAEKLEAQAKKLREEANRLKGVKVKEELKVEVKEEPKSDIMKCGWHLCKNTFVADPVKKKKFCCSACRMNQNSLIYRQRRSN